MTCWFSLVPAPHTPSQMPFGELFRDVRYPDWQKQDQICWLAVCVPPHAWAAWTRSGHEAAQAGNWLVPSARSWAVVELTSGWGVWPGSSRLR